MDALKTARVVIGAQFGDEGKGRLIDYYAAQVGSQGLVIRFNGGAYGIDAGRGTPCLQPCR
jgi:adenylosuccinate synthase